MEPNNPISVIQGLKRQISGVSTKLNDNPPSEIINLESNNTSQIALSHLQNLKFAPPKLSRNSSLNTQTADMQEQSITAKSCKEFNKEKLYSKPFFKSNFKFLDKKVKSKALDILKKRKKLRNLTIVQQKLQSTYNAPVAKSYTLDHVIMKVKSSKQTISQGRNLISSLESNLRKIEKELVVMKTQD